MPKEAIEPEAEVLDTPEIDEAVEQEAPEADDQEEQSEQAEQSDEGEEETVIGFADEEAEEESEADTPTIKRLRERNREQTKLLRDREKRIAELETSAPAKIEVGPEPTMEECEWDEATFKKKYDDWKERKADAEKQTEKAQEVTRRVQQSYERDLETYTTRKASLGVSDYEDAEATVIAALSLEQQAVALQAANDPAAMVYALSKSPSKLAELAKIDNPWKLAAAIARLEGQVKVTKTRRAPPPDRAQRGAASMQATDPDKELARLEKEAERTKDRTAVQAYQRQMKAKANAQS